MAMKLFQVALLLGSALASSIDYVRLQRSIVRIQSQSMSFSFFRPWQLSEGGGSIGTGFIIQVEPYILIATNQHVINDAPQATIQMLSIDETEWPVNVVSACPKFDLALLTVQDDAGLKKAMEEAGISPVVLPLSTAVATMGQDVIALGFPLGQNSMKASKGNVAGNEIVNSNICIQSTAPISPGNSGGPLLDEDGKTVVGVNFAKSTQGENVNFVIPAWRVAALMKKHLKDQPEMPTGNASWKRLGFNSPDHGFLTVQPNEALYRFTNGCKKGAYIGRVDMSGFVSKAVPPVKEGSMLETVSGVKVDAFGKGAAPKRVQGRVAIDDLFYMSEDLDEAVEFETCLDGKTTKHYVSTAMTDEFAKGIVEFKEPVISKLSEQYELIGDIGVMQMTRNHVIEAFKKSGQATITRWLLPEKKVKPRLMVIFVKPGSYMSNVLPEGASIEKVNGKKVRTLKDFRKALIPKEEENIWTLETDLGLTVALPFKETVVKQLQAGMRMEYVLTEGILQAGKHLGLIKAKADDEEKKEDDEGEDEKEKKKEEEEEPERVKKTCPGLFECILEKLGWWHPAPEPEPKKTGFVQLALGKITKGPKAQVGMEFAAAKQVGKVAAGPLSVVNAKHGEGWLLENSAEAEADNLAGTMEIHAGV